MPPPPHRAPHTPCTQELPNPRPPAKGTSTFHPPLHALAAPAASPPPVPPVASSPPPTAKVAHSAQCIVLKQAKHRRHRYALSCNAPINPSTNTPALHGTETYLRTHRNTAEHTHTLDSHTLDRPSPRKYKCSSIACSRLCVICSRGRSSRGDAR